MAITKNDVSKLYVALVNRVADKEGLDFWFNKGQDKSLSELANEMIQNEKTAADLKAGGVKDGDVNSFVTYIYKNLLNKADDTDGIKYWTDTATEKKADFGTILGWMLHALNDPEVQAKAPEVAKLYENKIAVAQEAVKLYDEAEKNGVTDEKFENYNLQLNSIFKTVNDNASSLDNAKADIKDLIKDLSYNDIALTDKTDDVVTGTAGNDKITGVVDSLTSKSTLQSSDKIDGGAGDDVLAVDLKANFNGFNKDGGVENVEKLELTNNTKIAKTFSANGITGLKEVVLNSASKISVNKLANIVDIELKGQEKGDLSVSYASKVTEGKEDVQNIILDSVGKAADKTTKVAQSDVNINISDIETINLQTKGGASFVKVTTGENMSVKGSADLGLSLANDAAKNLDASELNAKLIADLSSASKLESVKTGAGDDKITLSTIPAVVNIDAGAGENEIIVKDLKATTAQPTLENVQKVTFDKISGASTIDFTNSQKVSEITLQDVSATALFANSGISNVNFQGNGTQEVTVTGDQVAQISYLAPSSATKEAATVSGKLKVSDATNLGINIDKLAKTEKDNATIDAAAVENATISVDGTDKIEKGLKLTNAANLSSLDISSKTKSFTIDAENSGVASLRLTTDSDKSAIIYNSAIANAQEINLGGNGSVEFKQAVGGSDNENSLEINANGLSSLKFDETISNKASSSASVSIQLNNIKGDTEFAKEITSDGGFNLNANGLLGALTFTKAIASANGEVSINAGKTVKAVTFSEDITAKKIDIDLSDTLAKNVFASTKSLISNDITYKNSNIATTGADINLKGASDSKNTELKIDLGGSIGNDTFKITPDATNTKVTITGNTKIGTDTITFDDMSSATALTTIDASTVSGAKVTVSVASQQTALTTIKTGDGDDVITTDALQTDTPITINGGAGNDTFDLTKATTDANASKYVILEGLNVGDKIKFAADEIKKAIPLKDKETGKKDIFDIGAGVIKDVLNLFIGKEDSGSHPNDVEKTPYIFSSGGDTYLLYNKEGTTHTIENDKDILVKLVGVNAETFSADVSTGSLVITHL